MTALEASLLAPNAIDPVRLEANRHLDPLRKAELGQFMTPDSVARFMASLFSGRKSAVRLLDAGAGVGSLSAAFLNCWGTNGLRVHAYEIDPQLSSYLAKTLSHVDATIKNEDFIQDAVYQLTMGKKRDGFTHAILNPPYKKISSDSAHRSLLRAVGLETVNLYSAFVGVALELMTQGGELVAIIPRSFCNGLYYKPFRDWLFSRAALEHIHLFHSRTSAFHEDEVLQENVIIKLVRGQQQRDVTITTSSDTTFADLRSDSYPFADIVHDSDEQRFIHIPTAPEHTGIHGVPLAKYTLESLGLTVSTGPVVDFRLKEHLRQNPEAGCVPLLYPSHFANGFLEWPRSSKKPNAILSNNETKKWLYPSGYYTVVRRFSSKEERRRVVAKVVDPNSLPGQDFGFENHLNVFHSLKNGLDKDIAHGLAVFLNSTAVDEFFRRFSGHTQVNATDLRLIRYPSKHELQELGLWAQTQSTQAQSTLTQEMIDLQLERYGRPN